MSKSIRKSTFRSMLAAGACAVLAAPALADQSEPAARSEALLCEAFNRQAAGGSVFDSLLAPGVRWTTHGSGPVAGTYKSRDSFLEVASLPLVSGLPWPVVPDVHAIWAVEDTESSASTEQRPPPPGAHENQFVWTFRLEDERFAEAEVFLDLAAYQEVVENNEPVTD